uniref:Uncharacterized protein n=1 Tax=Caenorhabditis japonica TaxID=281687 RepID=A0A8R1E710_CAEJA
MEPDENNNSERFLKFFSSRRDHAQGYPCNRGTRRHNCRRSRRPSSKQFGTTALQSKKAPKRRTNVTATFAGVSVDLVTAASQLCNNKIPHKKDHAQQTMGKIEK